MCFLWILLSISIISLYWLNSFFFVMYSGCVLCEVGTEVLHLSLTSCYSWLNPVHSENCAKLSLNFSQRCCNVSVLLRCDTLLVCRLNPEDKGAKVLSKRRNTVTPLHSIRSQNIWIQYEDNYETVLCVYLSVPIRIWYPLNRKKNT